MFGNGTRTYHNDTARDLRTGERVRATFDNAMTAHTWAALSQSFGKSGNGNLYFEGRALFSYGRHYVAGFILPERVRDMGPDAFPAAELEGRGPVLIANDGASVATAGHLSDARAACRHMESHVVPESVVSGVRDLFELRGFRPGELADRAARLFAGLSAEDFPAVSQEAAAAVLKAAGARNPEAAARRALAKAARRHKAEADAKAREERAATLREASRAAEMWTPPALRARMAEEAREAFRRRWASRDTLERQWADKGRALFRAAKAAKAAGRTRQAAAVKALHAAVREGLPLFALAEVRAARLSSWRDMRDSLRTAAKTARDESVPMGRGRATYAGTSGAVRRAAFAEAARKASAMAEALAGESPWAAPRARLAGVDPAALAARLTAAAAELRELRDKENKADARAALRRELATLKAARDLFRRQATHLVAGRDLAAALKAAESILSRLAPSPYGGPTRKTPGAARLAGWNPERIGAELLTLKAARAAAEARAKEEAAAEARERAEREAAARAEAERNRPAIEARALAAWRAGEALGELRPYMPRGDVHGRAYIRARDVTRDASGRINGGTLETSQGAEVPLTHALRVFAFLKACRDKGEGWAANGRTLRAGPFTVDRVNPDGGFTAGCHAFAWEEVRALAEALGVFELEAADTTESSGTRH